MTAQPPSVPQVVSPAPVPTTLNLSTVQTPHGNLVCLRIFSPTGTAVYFFEPNSAIKAGEMLAREGEQARTGLVLPPGLNGHGPPVS